MELGVAVRWHETELARSLGVRLPIVQAPMAGGWTTPRLVAEVSEAGGLGSIAGALTGPDELRDLIRAVRHLTSRPFAVNIFAPLPEPSRQGMAEWARVTGTPLPAIAAPAFCWADQIAVLVEERVPVLSFTFGVLPLDGIESFTIGTATTVAEAVHCTRPAWMPSWRRGSRRAGTERRFWRRWSSP